MDKKYLTLEQASQMIQLPISSLRKKISDGLLPAYKPGKCVLVDIKELELFVRKNRVEHAS